jgi:hypothetical protein
VFLAPGNVHRTSSTFSLNGGTFAGSWFGRTALYRLDEAPWHVLSQTKALTAMGSLLFHVKLDGAWAVVEPKGG